MDSQLIVALAERIKAGHTKEQIKAEVLAVGHTEEAFEVAYLEAVSAPLPVPIPQTTPVAVLPQYFALVRESLVVTKTQLHILWKTLLTFVLIALTTALIVQVAITSLLHKAEAGTSYSLSAFLLMAGVVLLLLAAFVGMVAVFSGLLRAILRRKEQVSYRDEVWWAIRSIVPILLVSSYVQILTQVGYAFFIVPGLLFTIYLLFSMFFLLSGKKKGIAALVSSTSLVHGHFLAVFGRIIFSIAIIGVMMLISVAFAVAASFLPDPYAALLVLPILLFVIVTSFWQLCYTTVLFESLEKLPVAKPLPCKPETLHLIYKVIIVIVITVIVFMTALLGFGATSAFKHGYFTGEWTETSLKTDVMQKQLLALSIKNAYGTAEQNGSYEYVCASLSLPSDISCEDTATSVAIEAPLAEGFYCVDSLSYNEVSRRSIITLDGTCGVVVSQ